MGEVSEKMSEGVVTLARSSGAVAGVMMRDRGDKTIPRARPRYCMMLPILCGQIGNVGQWYVSGRPRWKSRPDVSHERRQSDYRLILRPHRPAIGDPMFQKPRQFVAVFGVFAR